ncbi:hypothetical protein [Serratia plymuthica]|uniref:hypothetical protein n=1 Tax=Serratia plymuthica TaxID=82996 RepID=UPI00141A588F|nr:hypothetical protein [Serratia plymuthica]NIC28268.1 hypothetical protein [Serratia plymuthica]
MLENYFKTENKDTKRLIATQAALEIIKASVSAPSGYDGKEKLDRDIKHTVENLSALTDAIQATLKAE